MVEQQRAEVRRAFGYYAAPAVVDEIIADPTRLELGGEVRELSLLFCDVRNFTSISEKLSAHELTRFINTLLTPLSEIILANRGTIDKYMGDAIMAFWNAPLDDKDHPENALKSALAMIRRMEDLNVQWRKDAEAAGHTHTEAAIGIGINSGNCCVGNLGSSQRFDYSAIGDDVNVARAGGPARSTAWRRSPARRRSGRRAASTRRSSTSSGSRAGRSSPASSPSPARSRAKETVERLAARPPCSPAALSLSRDEEDRGMPRPASRRWTRFSRFTGPAFSPDQKSRRRTTGMAPTPPSRNDL